MLQGTRTDLERTNSRLCKLFGKSGLIGEVEFTHYPGGTNAMNALPKKAKEERKHKRSKQRAKDCFFPLSL
jgi:hypothetical protein